jgi:prephenate dehydratase
MNKSQRAAFQGEPGAYSELAIIECFGARMVTIPCHAFDDVFAAVSAGEETIVGLIPIENSLAGSIHRNYDLMLRNELQIVGEYHLRVNHCLLALPGVDIADIQRVYSHPQALAQCEANLARLGVEMVAEADTAGSARLIRARADQHGAAIASKRAAQVYDLNVLAENLEDNPENFTRFLVLAQSAQQVDDPEGGDYKTSIVFSLHNQPGSLFKALSVFALRDIDLTKIESRPIQGRPWEYMFYVDFAGHIEAQTCKRALDHLSEYAAFLRILGSYPRHRLEK